MGIRDKPIAPASPWQIGFAERLIGSIRRECLDHIIVLGEAHLSRILKSYANYYNGARTVVYRRESRSQVRGFLDSLLASTWHDRSRWDCSDDGSSTCTKAKP
jgi:hypothetical protein